MKLRPRTLNLMLTAVAAFALLNCLRASAGEADLPDAGPPDDVIEQPSTPGPEITPPSHSPDQGEPNSEEAEDDSPAQPPDLHLEIELEAEPDEIAAPGGAVQYSLKIENETDGPVTIVSITDSLSGDLAQLLTDLQLPLSLAAGEKWEGGYQGQLTGEAGQIQENIITVAGQGADATQIPFQAKATVKITAPEPTDDESPDGESPDDDSPKEDSSIITGAVIGDWVWLDSNKDGLQSEGEPGLKDVVIQLISDEDDAVLAETVSDSEGHYTFTGDFPEEVYLKVKLPEDYAFTARRAGDDRALDNDIDPATGKSQEIKLSSSEIKGKPVNHASDWDIGLVESSEETPAPGVAGPGFWKNHLEAWPLDELTIGGSEYGKEEAAQLLTNGSDKSYTLFRSLVAALLNVASGAPSDCIQETLAKAGEWSAAHAPGSGVKASDESWRSEGEALNDSLEDYNEGRLCAPERHESTTPVSIKPGKVEREKGKPRELQLRVSAEKGRTLVLQKSSDLQTWVDVEVLQNLYGVSDALRAEILNDPQSFYRVAFPPGAAETPATPTIPARPFKQVGHDEQVQLLPIVYQGNLQISGNNNVVSGTLLNETANTVIAGDLIIAGNNNKVSQLTVLGKVKLSGRENELEQVDYQGGVEDGSNANNDY